MAEPRRIKGFIFKEWLETAGFELDSPTMWPEDYDALREEWEYGVDPYEYVGSKPRPPEFEDEIDSGPRVGSIVRYFDPKRRIHVEARVTEIETFPDPSIGGLYLTLDNAMCVHEDNCKVVMR